MTTPAPSAPSADPAPAAESAAAESGLRIGRFSGVPIYLSPSWFLIAALITWWFADRVEAEVPGLGPAKYAVSGAFALLLYGSVLIHELSHTVVALRAGLPVRRISLYLLGGVSEIEKPAQTPGVEARIAAAGPAISLVLAVIGVGVAVAFDRGTIGYLLAAALVWSNIVVGVFNLLPGLPLDGGRVLAAAVWKITKRQHSGTVVAAVAGRVLAGAVLLLPLAIAQMSGRDPRPVDVVWGAFIAWFIWVGATQSLHYAKVQQRIPALSARALARQAYPVTIDLPLAEALRRAEEAGARALVVVGADGEVGALVNGAAVHATPEDRRPWVPVGDVSRRLQPELVISADLAGDDLINVLARRPSGTEYLVLEADGNISGVLVGSDVERALVRS